jgi:hypothetical protein
LTTSSANRRAAKEEKARRVLRASLTRFKRWIFSNYIDAAHLALLDAHLEQVTRFVETGGAEGIGRLIIEMPPRHGKTKTVSHAYPTWHLGRNPDHRIMLASYGASLARKNSRAARNLIRSAKYQAVFPGIVLARDSKSLETWSLEEHEGGADAFGVAGAATGKGAHILVIDDPIKNREQAESDTYREKLWDAFSDDLSTRLEPGGAIIVMNTRWHIDDLTGRILKHEGEQWVRLSLPALAEEDDPLGREFGEALWEQRYPRAKLEERRARNAYGFASLYQQRPIPREGGLFKFADIERGRMGRAPEFARIVIAIDPAVTNTADSDETGIVAAGVAFIGGIAHGYVLDDLTLKASPAAWARRAVAAYHAREADRIVAEVNNGGDLVEHTIRTVDPNVPVTAVRASRGKATRAEPIAALYEQGRVHHVGVFPKLEDQMCTWVAGAGK